MCSVSLRKLGIVKKCKAKILTTRIKLHFPLTTPKFFATSMALITIVLVTKVIFTNEACVAFAFKTTKPNKKPSNTYFILTSIQL